MVKFVQLVMGPAGVGKSSYCKTMQQYGEATRRKFYIGNLDPAADKFDYEASLDIRELVNIDDIMLNGELGPNGALVYCMEYLLQNLNWLQDELNEFNEDDYIILDCPGQVELYSHLSIMHDLAKHIEQWGFRVAAVYLLDALFVLEPVKFISGCLLSLSCMMQLQMPHVGVITKCDIADKEMIERILDYEGSDSILSNDIVSSGKLKNLTNAIGSVIDDFMMVSFVMLDISDEDSIENVLLRIDQSIQYGKWINKNIYRTYYICMILINICYSVLLYD